MSCITGRRDVTVGATSRRNVQTGAQCRFWKRYRRGTKATSHSAHDERIRFSPKSSEYTAPATIIQRSKHCQTRVLGQKQAKVAHTSPFRLEVVKPYIRLGASPPYRLLDCLTVWHVSSQSYEVIENESGCGSHDTPAASLCISSRGTV